MKRRNHSTDETRAAARCPIAEEQSCSILHVGHRKQEARILNFSATGYRIRTRRRPNVEADDIVHLESAAGMVEARVVYILERPEEFQLGLKWVRDVQKLPGGPGRYHWLQRTVLFLGVAAVFAAALSPFVSKSMLDWQALLPQREQSHSVFSALAGNGRYAQRTVAYLSNALRAEFVSAIESRFPLGRKLRSNAPKDWPSKVYAWRRHHLSHPEQQPTQEEVEEALESLGYLEPRRE